MSGAKVYKHQLLFLGLMSCPVFADVDGDNILKGDNLEMGGSVNSLAEFILSLKRMFQHDSDTKTNSLTLIGLAHAEILRSVDFNVLPGLFRLSSLVESRLDSDVSHSICVILMSRQPWSKWEMESRLSAAPITVKLEPYSKVQLSDLLTQYLLTTVGAKRKDLANNKEENKIEELNEEFYRNFSDAILGTFHAVAKSFPQFVSAARMVLPVYMKPIDERKIEPDNSRALYRSVQPFLKECLSTANLKESYGQTFEDQMKLKMRSYDQNPSLEHCTPAEEPKTYSRLSVELPFFSKFLLISAYISSYNPVRSDKRFFMKHHGKFKKRVQKSASLAAHKRSSQLLGPKQFTLSRMLAIFYVIVDMDQEVLGCEGGASADILSQVSSLVTLNLLTQADNGLDSPKYKCNVGLDFIRLVAKNVRFEVHKYLYDIDN